MLSEKGSISYKQDSVNYLAFDDDLTIRIALVTNDVARMYFVNAQQVQQPVPPVVTVTDAAGAAVVPFLDNFLITWASSFTLSVNGQAYMDLSNLKQHAIRGPANAASGVVQPLCCFQSIPGYQSGVFRFFRAVLVCLPEACLPIRNSGQ